MFMDYRNNNRGMNDKNKLDKLRDIAEKQIDLYWHIYALLIIFVFTLYTRIQGANRLITENGNFALLGNDSWYHYRATMYSVENWPFVLGVDPKTGYPTGAEVGTFGTLYDQLHATVAHIIGLGSPSPELVLRILAYSSPVMAIGAVFLTYLLTKQVTKSKAGGVLAAGLLSLYPGMFYQRSVVGFANHHILEVILVIATVLYTIKLFQYSEQKVIVFDVVKEKIPFINDVSVREFVSGDSDVSTWFRLLITTTVFFALYYSVWPPGIMMYGVIAATVGIYSLINYSRNKPTEPVAFTSIALIALSALVVLFKFETFDPDIARPSIVHLAIAGITLAGLSIVYAVNNYMQRNNHTVGIYTISLGAIGALFLVGIGLIRPDVMTTISDNIFRLLGNPFGQGTALTIAEEQTTTPAELVSSDYGLTLVTFALGIIVYAYKTYMCRIKEQPIAAQLFFIITGIYFAVISIRTIRFNYYFAVFVAVFSVIAIKQALKSIDVPNSIRKVRGYHVIGILLIFSAVVPVLIFPMEGTVYDGDQTPVSTTNYAEWEEPLDWLSENSEENSYGTYDDYSDLERPVEYNEDDYGVMSWWDYGHWITATGDRTPIANPFQQHATEASEYLLADDPEEAEKSIDHLSDNDTDIRYVAVDWQMVSPLSKFNAITQFNDDFNQRDAITTYYSRQAGGGIRPTVFAKQQPYYESMMVRLFLGNAGRMEASDTVIDYSTESTDSGTIRTVNTVTNPIKKFNTSQEAREYADNNTEVEVGGVGMNPEEDVEALENYRLVKSANRSLYERRQPSIEAETFSQLMEDDLLVDDVGENPSAVKIFENVPGANIEGSSAPANSTIIISVSMRDLTTDNRFIYEQHVEADENGEFTATVPYSTTGYDENPNSPKTEATTKYNIASADGKEVAETEVPETKVVTEDSEPISVELERRSLEDVIDVGDGSGTESGNGNNNGSE